MVLVGYFFVVKVVGMYGKYGEMGKKQSVVFNKYWYDGSRFSSNDKVIECLLQ